MKYVLIYLEPLLLPVCLFYLILVLQRDYYFYHTTDCLVEWIICFIPWSLRPFRYPFLSLLGANSGVGEAPEGAHDDGNCLSTH